ncbi:SCO3242 family prenyltransferase [Streptomyces sp. NBC_01465]|uniref:SCO3242 family prenyltransferase n=1 Tax=Streptomyces sp. NBC_01465 TaxID=2903878 RepID=UPI002E2ED18E|nr:UbiA family prenyltransferase [Streptomyces sp. NBC_01465]
MSLRPWLELLRVSALFTVPGDALAGAAATGLRPHRGTAYAVGASLCLYEAGMALNDWADREEDARERPHRPIPSGRVGAGAALGASVVLTGAGLGLASRAGRGPLAVAAALAATVWSYDLVLKRTPVGPGAMAAARSLDLLLGAVATGPGVSRALTPAAMLGAHTYAVTTVSRHETQGGSVRAPLLALAAAGVISAAAARSRVPNPAPSRNWGLRPADPHRGSAPDPAPQSPEGLRGASQARPAIEDKRPKVAYGVQGRSPASGGRGLAPVQPTPGQGVWGAAPHAAEPQMSQPGRGGIGELLRAAATPAALAAVSYLATAATPYLHAALNPSPPLTQRAVGGGIRAMIPLQAALSARAGATGTAAALTALVPLARKLARKVSPT